MNSQQQQSKSSSSQQLNGSINAHSNKLHHEELVKQEKAEQANNSSDNKITKIDENKVKNLNQKVISPKMKIQTKQTIKIKEEKMFDRVINQADKFHSQSPPTSMKHRGLMDSSSYDDLNCRNDEESIMVSKNYDQKKRSHDASNSQRTSTRHSKINDEGHDIKIELEAKSQNSQDPNESEIKEETEEPVNQEQKEFVNNQGNSQNILSASEDKQLNETATARESSELERRDQSGDGPSQGQSVGQSVESETSPSKAGFFITERGQNSNSSESNLSTPESRTGTGIQEDLALIENNKREVVEPEEEDDPESSIIEMIFVRYKFRDFNQFAESQDAEQIINDLNLDQMIRLSEEINNENSALKNSKIRLQMLIDDALKKRQSINSTKEFFGDTFQQNNVMFVDVEIDGDCQQQWNDQQNYSLDFDKQPTEKFRAKLYQLDGDGRWNDLGTGYFSIDHVPDQGEGLYKMTLQQEHNSNIDLLENEIIQPHIQFHRQRETIITWTDKQRDQDLAVSFQNNSGAWQTWQRICQILGTDPDQNSQDSQVQEEFENFTVIARETIQNMAEELKNVNVLDGQIRQDIADKFLDNDQQNLIKLGELFEEIESECMKNKKEIIDENLLCFFYIYKGLISLYDQRLLEMLLSNKYYMQTFGALEWDPDALQPSMIDTLYPSQQDLAEENGEGQNYEEYQDQDEYDAVQADKKTQQEIEESQPSDSQNRGQDMNDDEANNGVQPRFDSRNIQFKNQDQSRMNIYGLNHSLESHSRMQPFRFHDRKNKISQLWGDQIVNTSKLAAQECQDQDQNETVQQDEIEKEVQEKETESEIIQEIQTLSDKINEAVQPNIQETSVADDAMEDTQQQSVIVQQNCNSPQSEFGSDGNANDQKSCLNYREFLSKIVKFKKVVDFTQDPSKFSFFDNTQGQGQENGLELQGSDKFDLDKENQPTDEGMENGANQGIKPTIEERIHINYRLQYLKDTVMARYIDEQASNFINGLIMANNREIVTYIFAQPKQMFTNERSLKDQIIDKIRDKSDLSQRHQAIEFMIELCQILKNLSFAPGGIGGGGANQFIYGSQQQNQNQVNSRMLYDQLSSANFIGLLAETFSIFVPCQQSFETHFEEDLVKKKQKFFEIFRKQNQDSTSTAKKPEKDTQEIEEPDNLSKQEQIEQNFSQMERLDVMKVNSMEIIISFQQSVHVPNSSITKYLTGTDQCSNQYPFLRQLVNHLIYSTDQGLKVQICDFFKGIFEVEQNQHSSMIQRETLYNYILQGFINFIQKITKDENVTNLSSCYNPMLKSYEYSLYLILQILNKVITEHRYTLRQWACQQNAIPKIAKLVNLKSKLINIEIVKFYKSLMRNKDPIFMVEIIKKNLFYPINDIFEATFDQKNPPMIQSCIRELYEMILGKSTEKGCENEFGVPKIAYYLFRDDPQSKSIIFNQTYKEVFGKFQLQDGFSVDFVFDKNNQDNPYQQVSSSNGGSPIPHNENDQNEYDTMGQSHQQQMSYQHMRDAKRKRGNKRNPLLNFQQDNIDDDCFLEYNSMGNKGSWNKLRFVDINQEILECEENGFENILSPSKQSANKKDMNIHNYDENDDRAEDAGSLSPLASKTNRNNEFQDDLFPQIQQNEDHKNSKDTSDYLFNYDLQDEEEEPKQLPINLQLEQQMSEETNSNPNSQREPEFEVLYQKGRKEDNNDEIEHNKKAFEQIIQDKKSSNLKFEQQQFKESLQQQRRQSSGSETSFLKQTKKDNLKISLFDNFDNLKKNEKYSSPKMSPRQTLSDNVQKSHSQVQEPIKFCNQFKSKSIDKVSNSSSDFHFGDDDLAKDMGIFNQTSDIKKQACSVSSTSSIPIKSKIIQGLSANNKKQSPCSRSVSSQVVNNSIERNINKLRRNSFDDQVEQKVRVQKRTNSAEKHDMGKRISISEKDQGRQSADKTVYQSAENKSSIECNKLKIKTGSPVPLKSDNLEANQGNVVLGIKRKIDSATGHIQSDDKWSDGQKIKDKEEDQNNGISNKKQKLDQ